MPVILEKGNTDVGLRAGEFIQKNRQMALQQALAAQEAQRDIARMAIQREQALQQQRYQMDQALREDARAAADLQYRYDALGQSKTLAEMDRESRLGESAASRAQALRLAEMGELGADRRADRAERGDERREQSALEREKMAAERHTALLESNRRDALESLDINLREKREKEERDRAQKETDANMQARLKAEALGLGPIPEDASTEGIMRLAGVTQSNKEQIATAEKRYNDLQERLINYTSRIDNPTPDQSNVIRQLNEESKAAFAHLNWLKQTIQTGGDEQSPQRAPLPVPQAPLGTEKTRARDLSAVESAYKSAAGVPILSMLANPVSAPLLTPIAAYRSFNPDEASARSSIAETMAMQSLTGGTGGMRQTPKGQAPSIEALQRMEAMRLGSRPWWQRMFQEDVDYTSGTGPG